MITFPNYGSRMQVWLELLSRGSHSLPRPAGSFRLPFQHGERPLEPAHLVAPGAVAGAGMPDWEAKAGLVVRGTGLRAGPWLCSICEVLEGLAQSSLPGRPVSRQLVGVCVNLPLCAPRPSWSPATPG